MKMKKNRGLTKGMYSSIIEIYKRGVKSMKYFWMTVVGFIMGMGLIFVMLLWAGGII